MSSTTRPAVVFLVRGRAGGAAAAREFLETYARFPAGAPHELILLRKAFDVAKAANSVAQAAARLDGRVIDLPDDGFDWGAYFRASRILSNDSVLFLNTHSRILRANWLADYLAAASGLGVGIVGATGSWQTRSPGAKRSKPVGYATSLMRHVARNRTWVHGLVEGAQQLSTVAREQLAELVSSYPDFYPGFPNPHVRSNAFLVRRDLFCAFADVSAMPRDKREAFWLESGRPGLTRFLGRRGLRCLLVAAGGRAFEPEEWDKSGTFRVPGQPNLLVGDNVSRLYMDGTPWDRRIYELWTWGYGITEAEPPEPPDGLPT